MRTLFSVFARLILCLGSAALTAILCGLLTDTPDFIAQCIAYWTAPASMWKDLIQNFPFLKNIVFSDEIVNGFFSGHSALFSNDKQYAIFADLYFVVLSTVFINLMEFIFEHGARLLDSLCGTLHSIFNLVCTVVCPLFIAYLSTGAALALRDQVSVLFTDNYVTAFLVLFAILAILHLVRAIMIAPFKTITRIFDKFLDELGKAVLDLLYVAILYMIVLLMHIERTSGLSFGYVTILLICGSVFLIMTIRRAVDTYRESH